VFGGSGAERIDSPDGWVKPVPRRGFGPQPAPISTGVYANLIQSSQDVDQSAQLALHYAEALTYLFILHRRILEQ
jgi:hypothetical protein